MIRLTSVNVGQQRSIQLAKRIDQTGIYKLPVSGRALVTVDGLEGDVVCDERHHGGPDQAIYVYGGADYAWWAEALGRVLEPGTFGENLTVEGLESSVIQIGDRLVVGEVILQATAPRYPCSTLAARMGDGGFVKQFRQAGRPGVYCRVLQGGRVQAGDPVRLERYPGETVTVGEMFRDHYEPDALDEQLERTLMAPIAARARAEIEERLGS